MQIATWLAELPAAPPVEPAHLEDLRAELERVAVASVQGLSAATTPGTGVLRLPKSRLAELGRCERAAVAAARPGPQDEPIGPAMLRGVALDRFVIHQLHAGRVLEPAAALRSMLLADGDWRTLTALDQLEESGPTALAELLDPLAGSVAEAWAGIDAAWRVRTQTRATLGLAGGRVVCSGIVDVELGGGPAERPTVVVEVKSGAPSAAHQSEVALYALLVALRDGRAPSYLARWYPGSPPAALTVTPGVLESAARRLADGVARWAELVAGRAPAENPGPGCSWCPDSADCPSAGLDAGADDGLRQPLPDAVR